MEKGIGVIIQNFDNTFLLHLRDENAEVLKNQCCLVGGNVEDEEIEEAVIREVKEETNLDISNLKFFKKFKFHNKEICIYHGTVGNRKQKMILKEGKELKFFTIEEFRKLFEKLNYSNLFLNFL